MVTMQIAGITIEVPIGDVAFYKSAGYSVVAHDPAPVEVVAPVETPAEPAPEKTSKKK